MIIFIIINIIILIVIDFISYSSTLSTTDSNRLNKQFHIRWMTNQNNTINTCIKEVLFRSRGVIWSANEHLLATSNLTKMMSEGLLKNGE